MNRFAMLTFDASTVAIIMGAAKKHPVPHRVN